MINKHVMQVGACGGQNKDPSEMFTTYSAVPLNVLSYMAKGT